MRDMWAGQRSGDLCHAPPSSIQGFMQKAEAERLLLACSPGTFLIRFSEGEPGGISVAWVTGEQGWQVWPPCSCCHVPWLLPHGPSPSPSPVPLPHGPSPLSHPCAPQMRTWWSSGKCSASRPGTNTTSPSVPLLTGGRGRGDGCLLMEPLSGALRLYDLGHLVYLFPSKPKDEVFGKYYTMLPRKPAPCARHAGQPRPFSPLSSQPKWRLREATCPQP